MAGTKLTDQQAENLRIVYQQLCSSYGAIDDFRSKLLGFLPLISGAGISFFVTSKDGIEVIQNYLSAIGLFGFYITLGLFCFELYGIKKCTALIRTGKNIESELGINAGQFTQRPLGFLDVVNEPFASGIIYSTVLAAWGYFAFDYSPCVIIADFSFNSGTNAFKIFLISFLISLVYDIILSREKLIKAWRIRFSRLKIIIKKASNQKNK